MDDAKQRAVRAQRQFPHVDPIQGDTAALGIEKAHQQVGHRRFPGAAAAHQGHDRAAEFGSLRAEDPTTRARLDWYPYQGMEIGTSLGIGKHLYALTGDGDLLAMPAVARASS